MNIEINLNTAVIQVNDKKFTLNVMYLVSN